MNKIKLKITEIDSSGSKFLITKIFIDDVDLRQIIFEIESADKELKKIKEPSVEGVDVNLYKTWQDFSEIPSSALMVLVCTCQEPGCGSATVKVAEKDNKIIWSNFTHYPRIDYSNLTWEFDKDQYHAEVESLERNISEIRAQEGRKPNSLMTIYNQKMRRKQPLFALRPLSPLSNLPKRAYFKVERELTDAEIMRKMEKSMDLPDGVYSLDIIGRFDYLCFNYDQKTTDPKEMVKYVDKLILEEKITK